MTMKPLIAICVTLLLGGCHAATIAATAGAAYLQGRNGDPPPPPRPQTVRVEVEPRPTYCYSYTIGNQAFMNCH
jgi:hypothetical protein